MHNNVNKYKTVISKPKLHEPGVCPGVKEFLFRSYVRRGLGNKIGINTQRIEKARSDCVSLV